MFKTKICHFELIWLQTTLQVHMFNEHIRLCNWRGIELYLIHVVIQIRLQRVFWLEVLQCYSVSFNFVAPICSFNLLLGLIFTGEVYFITFLATLISFTNLSKRCHIVIFCPIFLFFLIPPWVFCDIYFVLPIRFLTYQRLTKRQFVSIFWTILWFPRFILRFIWNAAAAAG